MTATTVFTNVRAFDGTGVTEPRTVIVHDGLITDDVTSPANAETVDGSARVLLPGLIDSHVHIDTRSDLEQCARAGVTTVLDLATRDLAVLDSLRDLAGLPTVLRAGMPASAPGGTHTRRMGFASSSAVTSAADAARFVADRASEGVDYIKVIVEDPRMPGTAALPAPAIAAIVTAAHTQGLMVIAHAVTSAALRLADDAGVDVITHTPLNRDLSPGEASALASRGSVLIPTLTMMRGVSAVVGGKLMFRLLRRLKVAPPVEYAHARGSVAAARAAGLTIVAGTDANNETGAPFSPPHGTSLADELELMVDAGLTPAEAIRSATALPAWTFGLNDRGAIAAGRRADLLLVDGEPTADIAAIRNVRGVWIAGARVV
ncbi:MAG TPA: amidohydrolase family protein [Streptosporangiaceae bacterium]